MWSDEMTLLVNYLDLPLAAGDANATWELFQLQQLNLNTLLAITHKSRQVGWSWLAAAESVAHAYLVPKSTCIFISINRDEAAEKIRYARTIWEALDDDVRPVLARDNVMELEFTNGSRLISHPCRPIRGKAKAYVYLDEFAHYPNDRMIYQSVLPVISKGGVIRIGSSPYGARGLFWEIYTQSLRTYPGYVREHIPWWVIGALCNDVPTATVTAPTLMTEQRVYKFGTPRLIQIYENMLEDDFKQEYECEWLDESVSWIDWDLIKLNQQQAQQDKLLTYRAKNVNDALHMIDLLAHDVVKAYVEQSFVGGMDVGRTHDLTEILLHGQNEMTNTLPLRLHISLSKTPFDKQQDVVSKLLNVLPVTQFLIDKNGIGMEMAERMHYQFSDRAQGFDFTRAGKELIAVETKLRFQRGEVPIPLDRDLMYQIHSIRKVVTDAKNAKFDVEANEKHHADQFWAMALAIWAGKEPLFVMTPQESPLDGYRG